MPPVNPIPKQSAIPASDYVRKIQRSTIAATAQSIDMSAAREPPSVLVTASDPASMPNTVDTEIRAPSHIAFMGETPKFGRVPESCILKLCPGDTWETMFTGQQLLCIPCSMPGSSQAFNVPRTVDGHAIITFAALSDVKAGPRDLDGLREYSVEGLHRMWVTRGPWPCKPFLIHCGPTGAHIENEYESPDKRKHGSSVWISKGNYSHGLAESSPDTCLFRISPSTTLMSPSAEGSLNGAILEAWSHHSDGRPAQQSRTNLRNVLDDALEKAADADRRA